MLIAKTHHEGREEVELERSVPQEEAPENEPQYGEPVLAQERVDHESADGHGWQPA